MAGVNRPVCLSVVIPALDEAARLPALLADLNRWPVPMDILVVDGGSRDATAAVAERAGATVLHSPVRGRGQQLQLGTTEAQGQWLLILHADSRLDPGWPPAVDLILRDANAADDAWYFDFRVEGSRPMLRVLEAAVACRSGLLQCPYGDQGLLIHRRLLHAVGGYRDLPLMEDLDLVARLRSGCRLRRIGLPLTTSDRRWQSRGVLEVAWSNARLRRRWARGENPLQLAADYNAGPSSTASWHTRTHNDAAAVPVPNPDADRN